MYHRYVDGIDVKLRLEKETTTHSLSNIRSNHGRTEEMGFFQLSHGRNANIRCFLFVVCIQNMPLTLGILLRFCVTRSLGCLQSAQWCTQSILPTVCKARVEIHAQTKSSHFWSKRETHLNVLNSRRLHTCMNIQSITTANAKHQKSSEHHELFLLTLSIFFRFLEPGALGLPRGPPHSRTCPKHLAREVHMRHPDQMPPTTSTGSLNMEQQLRSH